MTAIELGLDTFGDVTLGADGKPKPMDQVLRDVVEEAVLADQVGISFIGLGEHHRADFAISSPEIVLATIAGQVTVVCAAAQLGISEAMFYKLRNRILQVSLEDLEPKPIGRPPDPPARIWRSALASSRPNPIRTGC